MRKHEKTHSSRTLQEALPHAQDAAATLASPASLSVAETSQIVHPPEITPYDAPNTEAFGSFDTPGHETSGVGGHGDEHEQGLFDFDLAWTFDFLDKGDESHAELSATRTDAIITTQEIDSINDRSNTIALEVVPQPPLSDEHTPTSNLDDEEINDMLRTWSDASLKALAVDNGLRSNLLEIATLNDTTDSPRRGFPSCRSLQHFLLLYIRRVHPRFPAIHVPTLSTVKTPAIVLMAMMLAGSCHSVSNGDRFCREYLDRCRYWLTAAREKDLKSVSTHVIRCESCLTICPARQHRSYVGTISMHTDCHLERKTSRILQGRAGPWRLGPGL